MTRTGWRQTLNQAIVEFCEEAASAADVHGFPREHFEETPVRVVRAFEEMQRGLLGNPADILKLFPNELREVGEVDKTVYTIPGSGIVRVKDISFVSYCAHHLMPFWGKATFTYVPNGQVVGLSKFARFTQLLAAQPQTQEHFTNALAKLFYERVKPEGVRVHVEAQHSCMMLRGVRESATTETQSQYGTVPEIKA